MTTFSREEAQLVIDLLNGKKLATKPDVALYQSAMKKLEDTVQIPNEQRGRPPKAIAVGEVIGDYTMLSYEPSGPRRGLEEGEARVRGRWTWRCKCGREGSTLAENLAAHKRGRYPNLTTCKHRVSGSINSVFQLGGL